ENGFCLLRIKARGHRDLVTVRGQRIAQAWADQKVVGERIPARLGWPFVPADKVMQIANDYEKEEFNGDVGTVSSMPMPPNSRFVSMAAR
ncbi:MAG: hypothetical protein ACRC1L_09065, partial [Prochlorococcaceae cyanobacterium]